MSAIAIIPARGGSKRLPKKNILPFNGSPMIAHTIRAAIETGLFEQVCVSTEDETIANIAEEYGANLHERPPELAQDQTMVAPVVMNVLDQQEQAGRNYESLCVLYATAPLRDAGDIQATFSLLEPDICTHSIAVTNYVYPPHQALKSSQDCADVSPMWPDIVAARSDSLPELVVDNGSTYCIYVDAFKNTQKFYSDKMRAHHMPRWKSIDIDTADDMDLLEYYAKKYGTKS